MIRSIFAKILIWFWLSMFLVVLSVVAISIASGVEPEGRRWLSHVLDLYGSSAVDFYTHGGAPKLDQFLDDIQKSSGVQAALLDPQGNEVSGRGIPRAANAVLSEARATGHTQFRTRFQWSGAAVVPTANGNFIFVAQIHPLRGYWRQFDLSVLLLRLSVGLLAAGLLSYLLARHIGKPIRAMQTAAGRIAHGDLTVRTSPAIQPRADELADLARDFDRMAEHIQSLLQQQKELLGDISHELRSPLTRLTVSLELARRGDPDAFEQMQSDLERLDALIGRILTLTRLEAGGARFTEAEFNLRTILEGVAEDARVEGKREDKIIVLSQADDCWTKGDANLLRSCFENVIRNAVRYTRPRTGVEVSLALHDAAAPRALVRVADRGPGVPPEALPRLFEPFFRVEESRDPAAGGTGLGLSIAQKVAALHGGTIQARNREGGGLEIDIVIPARRSSSETHEK